MSIQSNLYNELPGVWGQHQCIRSGRHTGRSPLCCYSVPEGSTDAGIAVHTRLHLQLETHMTQEHVHAVVFAWGAQMTTFSVSESNYLLRSSGADTRAGHRGNFFYNFGKSWLYNDKENGIRDINLLNTNSALLTFLKMFSGRPWESAQGSKVKLQILIWDHFSSCATRMKVLH